MPDGQKKRIIQAMTKNRVSPRRPSGFPEYTPAQQLAFNDFIYRIRTSFETAGFTPIETPALELSQVLLAKGGGDTEKEIYQFSKGNKDYSLHYDLTVPLARYVAEHQNDLVFPFRRSQIQKVWRAERAQKGRSREFYQCDADVVGESDVAVDGEVIALAASTIRGLEIGPFVIKINNRKLLTGVYEELGLSDKSVEILRLVDKLEKIGHDDVVKQLKALGLTSNVVDKLLTVTHLKGPVESTYDELLKLGIQNQTFVNGMEELDRTIEAARAAGVDESELEIDCSKARGLDYYTATVFETVLTEHLDIGSICSGGRYDDLAQYYTDRALPGVGISIGLTRLFDGLLSANKIDLSRQTTSHVIILPLDESTWSAAGELAQKLQAEGVACEVQFGDTKPAKVFSRADKLGVQFVAVIGPDELAKDSVTIKNMANGEQASMAIGEAIARLSSH